MWGSSRTRPGIEAHWAAGTLSSTAQRKLHVDKQAPVDKSFTIHFDFQVNVTAVNGTTSMAGGTMASQVDLRYLYEQLMPSAAAVIRQYVQVHVTQSRPKPFGRCLIQGLISIDLRSVSVTCIVACHHCRASVGPRCPCFHALSRKLERWPSLVASKQHPASRATVEACIAVCEHAEQCFNKMIFWPVRCAGEASSDWQAAHHPQL
jgi:hypothetical protein